MSEERASRAPEAAWDTVVVQAGGLGSRLKRHTRNKPKAIVPIENLPMIFHLFRKYPKKRFIVIADYKLGVLERYLQAFAEDVNWTIVDGKGAKGTCGGLRDALDLIDDGEAFLLIWCDLVLSPELEIPCSAGNVIGISTDFECRWSYVDGEFVEEPSRQDGVAGLFRFASKECLADVPREGEFVRYLQGKNLPFERLSLAGCREFGLVERIDELPVERCRPFNSISVEDGAFVKRPIDDQGRRLAKLEIGWYQHVRDAGIDCIPEIYSYEPLAMELVNGKNIYEYKSLSLEQKQAVLERLVNALKRLHAYETSEADRASIDEAYVTKTFDRLDKVERLVPFADGDVICVNGVTCRNPLRCRAEIEQLVDEMPCERFALIHGDCTFSNLMLDSELRPVLIDPRGYFGHTQLFGDPKYDWAKLYYSIAGNYDQFNLGRFDLDIREEDVLLSIESNGWEQLEDCYLKLVADDIARDEMLLLHAIIWLSLTTYAWQNYDAICGAFYNGTLALEKAMAAAGM